MTRMVSVSVSVSVSVALVALAACDDEGVDPITKITAPRVLAITSEPSALLLEGELALTVLTVDPEGPRIDARAVDALRLRACTPWKFVADPTRECIGDDALPLQPDATGAFVTSAAALAMAFPSPPGIPAPPDPWGTALAMGLALRIPIIAEVDVDGETLIARRDLDLVESTTQRLNPTLDEIRFDGSAIQTLRADQRYVLTATIAPTSLDGSPDSDPVTLEKVTCHFYSPAGALAEAETVVDTPDALVPETEPNTYTTGPPGTTWLFVVSTDETGGMSSSSLQLTIE